MTGLRVLPRKKFAVFRDVSGLDADGDVDGRREVNDADRPLSLDAATRAAPRRHKAKVKGKRSVGRLSQQTSTGR